MVIFQSDRRVRTDVKRQISERSDAISVRYSDTFSDFAINPPS